MQGDILLEILNVILQITIAIVYFWRDALMWLLLDRGHKRRAHAAKVNLFTLKALQEIKSFGCHDVESTFISLENGITLHAVTAGPKDGQLAICLHGFPECWHAWSRQIPFLATLGYRVVVPDLRGFNLSSKPKGVDQYAMPQLVQDLVLLIRELNKTSSAHQTTQEQQQQQQQQQQEARPVLLGHDIGAYILWHFAMQHPDLVDRIVIINSPPPLAIRSCSPLQYLRSWYFWFHSMPVIPELAYTLNFRSMGRRLLFSDCKRFTRITRALELHLDLEAWACAWTQPGAITSMLNYYRAIVTDFLEERVRRYQKRQRRKSISNSNNNNNNNSNSSSSSNNNKSSSSSSSPLTTITNAIASISSSTSSPSSTTTIAAAATTTTDSLEEKALITVPTLVLWSADDKYVMVEQVRGLEKKLVPNMELHTVDNCSHWMLKEAAEDVEKLVTQFLLSSHVNRQQQQQQQQ